MARDRTPRRKGRPVDYVHLTHPFTSHSDDAVAAQHNSALGVLERAGMKILLPQARSLFAAAGARVAADMVSIGRDIVQSALRQWQLRAANPAHLRLYTPGQLLFRPGAGCPNATYPVRGRRPTPLRYHAMMQAQITRAAKPMSVYAHGRAQVHDSLRMIRLGLNLPDGGWASDVWAYTVINTKPPRPLHCRPHRCGRYPPPD